MANTSMTMSRGGITTGPQSGPGGYAPAPTTPLPSFPLPAGGAGAPGGPSGGAPSGGGPGGSGPPGTGGGGGGPSGSGGGPSGGPTGGGPTGGGPTGGPTGGGTGGSTGGTGGGLGSAGGGPGTTGGGGTTTTTGGSSNGYYVDPGFNSAIAGSFINLLQNASSPDALESQNIILRRIALEGDVIGSRVPPPKNITEIGGYLNLLATLNQPELRSQMLAGILGVAGPNPPLGWISTTKPQLTFVSIANDRPTGAAQGAIPLAISVRSDFVDALKTALGAIHDQGAMLPLESGPTAMPPSAPGTTAPADILPYLGRVLYVVPATAVTDPTTDVIALVRKTGTTDPYQIAARVLSAGTVPVTAGNYDAIKCTPTASSTVTLTGVKLAMIAAPLSAAGFYPTAPLPVPANLSSTSWSRLTNVTRLIKGVTKLGDELMQLYSWSDIANSVFAPILTNIWDGTTFSTPK